jgi:hypothetical protein
MTNEILYKHALDEKGNVIKIETAKTGQKYFCTVCHNEMIFKNGKIRQKHFSHKNITENCGGKGGSGGEGYLHETFKNMLFQKLTEAIKDNKPLEINWICNVCNQKEKGNLLGNIKEIKMEHTIDNCRPDIVLIDDKGNNSIIIEVVDKHEPEQNVIELCQKYNIILIKIKLENLEDLEKIDEKIINPTNLIRFNKLQCLNFYNWAVQQQQQQNNIRQQLIYQQMLQLGAYQPRPYIQGGARIDAIDKQLDRYGSYSPKRNGGRSYGGGKTGRGGGYRKRK